MSDFKLVPLATNTAENILARLVANFPGLLNGEDEVPGAELVDWLSDEFYGIDEANPLFKLLKDRAENGSPEDDEQNEAGYAFPNGKSGAQ